MIPEELGKIDQFLGDCKEGNGTRKENPRVFNLIMQWKVSFETEEAIRVSHKHTNTAWLSLTASGSLRFSNLLIVGST